jgi:hypothetical protein
MHDRCLLIVRRSLWGTWALRAGNVAVFRTKPCTNDSGRGDRHGQESGWVAVSDESEPRRDADGHALRVTGGRHFVLQRWPATVHASAPDCPKIGVRSLCGGRPAPIGLCTGR